MKKRYKIIIGVVGGLGLILLIALTPPGSETHQSTRLVKAPKEIVWPVIADVQNYHKYATGLTHVAILSGSGKGMVRSCSDSASTWTEICTIWEEGKTYAFEVNMESGFPFPFRKFSGTWSLHEQPNNKTQILISFQYRFPQRWMRWFFSQDTHRYIEQGNKTLFDNWVAKINEEVKNKPKL